jgi:HAD superfamily hydrolase (TIGR01490 family)
MLQMISGWNRDNVASIVREALDEIVTPIIYAEALDLIDLHHAAGRTVVIVSSSPEEVVGPLGEFLGVDAVIATRAEVDPDGNYTGNLQFYGYGPHKADAVREMAAREGIDLAESYAYSDSITDEPMLRAVGHPVVVNPDRDLSRIARAEGWRIERFEHPVRLRDRVPMPAVGPSIAVGGALAAAGGVATWWWLRHRTRAA